MYKTGDHVFYPKGGVFVIERESDKKIAGRSICFFDLVSNDGKTKISIPKTNVNRVGVRKLVSSQELDSHMEGWIPDIKISKLHHKNRKSRFETLRQTGNFTDMGSVMVTIHYLMNKTKATFEEKRMYDQIRKRMVDEIEIIKGWQTDKVDTLVQEALDEAILRKPSKDLDEDVVAADSTEELDTDDLGEDQEDTQLVEEEEKVMA